MPELALLAIPAYYIMCLAPHIYAVTTASKYTQWNNANPRSGNTTSSLQQKLPASIYAKFERAEAAHKNSIENFPLFAAAIGAGMLAEKAAGKDVGTTTFAGIWLVVRALYSILYINTESQSLSAARSWTFMIGTGLAFWQIWKSAVALA